MVKLILAVAFAIVIGTQTVKAVSIDATNLTPTQKAEMELQIAQLIETNSKVMSSVPDADAVMQASQWVNIGTDIGKGLAGAASELGVAADKFADTSVGMFTMFLIGYHFIGKSIIGIMFGLLWLFTTIPTWVWFYRRQFIIESITTYENGKGPDGIKSVTKFMDKDPDSEGERVIYLVVLIGITIVGTTAIF